MKKRHKPDAWDELTAMKKSVCESIRMENVRIKESMAYVSSHPLSVLWHVWQGREKDKPVYWSSASFVSYNRIYRRILQDVFLPLLLPLAWKGFKSWWKKSHHR